MKTQRWWWIGLTMQLACARSQPSLDAGAPELPPVKAELSSGERAQLVARIADQLQAHYIFPEVAAQMAAALRDRQADAGYEALVTAEGFAQAITDQMREVSHDRHALLERTPSAEQASAEEAKWKREEAENAASAGFGAVERLPGNVAHLVLNSFESPDPKVNEAVVQHLSAVADADALVIDLRANHGGDPRTVTLIASYLFEAPRVHLNDLKWRDNDETWTFWTDPNVKGAKFGAKKPVLVLTSKHTFSAAEEFAYDLQAQHRAQIVGEATAGGAHPVDIEKLSPLLTLRVPTGRAINPITKTDWEGTGVQPDVATDADAALQRAQGLALRAILASSGLSATRRSAAQGALAALGE
jgi:C-terminal processing protease CtpA/Prc